MPRFRQVADIIKLMSRKDRIRNVAIVAHIDHGKTTLTDALLAGTGLLSPSVAGSARVLDYLEEEQKRGITMKTANISLLYKTGERSFVVNLVDTPGHVDFTGKVTRALRAVDGAVVVVDAVEEIMAQTEIVTRQALEERVRPVLFINKIDKLITELQLNAEQVEKKLERIISGFNDLIGLHGEKPLREKWKANAAHGDVAFGSALHGWGFTLSSAKAKSVKFNDIIAAYASKRHEVLRERLPVYEAVFEIAVNGLPNPKEAQAYRIEKIWKGVLGSQVGRAMVDCDQNGPTALCVTSVKPDLAGCVVATGRLFSGTVRRGGRLHVVGGDSEMTVEHVYVEMGAFREEVEQVPAGNIVALSVSDVVHAGDTFVDPLHATHMVPFERASYVSEPVVTVAVEPQDPEELPVLLEALNRLALEDPNLQVKLDSETGEYLLAGMGELHLEVALKQLSSALRVGSSSPRVVYAETVTAKGVDASARSPNKQNRFVLRVEPRNQLAGTTAIAVDERGNVLLDASGKTSRFDESGRNAVVAGFKFACAAGPLCSEPVRGVQAVLVDATVPVEAEWRIAVEVERGVGKAFFGSFLTAKPVLLEPIYRAAISVPLEFVGEVGRILAAHRGRVSGFEAKGALAVVAGFVPVAESFYLSRELRSATSGRAFWQLLFDRWERFPPKLAAQVILETRRRKGLTGAVPEAARFLEG